MNNLLAQNKSAVLKRWQGLIFDTYPADASSFIKKRRDEFHNPVGHTISRETENIYDELINEMDGEKLAVSLDNIIRIRSVQDYSPSQAVSFVFLLRQAIREEMGDDWSKHILSEERSIIEGRIDGLAGIAFDIYMKCREKIFEIRINEVKRGSFKPHIRTEGNSG